MGITPFTSYPYRPMGKPAYGNWPALQASPQRKPHFREQLVLPALPAYPPPPENIDRLMAPPSQETPPAAESQMSDEMTASPLLSQETTAPEAASGMNASAAKSEPVNKLLIDPIAKKKYHLESEYDDKLLRLNVLDKIKLDLQNVFVKIPTAIYKGLRGDSHFTFSDHLNISNVPYYLGGTFLALSARMGRDKLNFARQGMGVLLYYLGVITANKGINAFYKAKSGVDLDLKYRKNNGDIEDVFASADFFRSDLLEDPKDYKPIRQKLHVPDNIADSKREVQDQIRNIIIASRFDKLLLANVFAALGAGYLARSDAWGRLPEGLKSIGNIWQPQNKDGGCLMEKVTRTGQAVRGTTGPALREMILGYSGEKNPMWRKGLLGGAAAFTGLLLAHGWYVTGANRNRDYESPFIANLSPELSPELSSNTATLQRHLPGGTVTKLPRKGVFEVAQQIESSSNTGNAGGQA